MARIGRASLPLLVLAVVFSSGGIGGASPIHSAFSVSISATPSTGNAPLFVSFSATVLSGTPTRYNWSFGDGDYYNGSATPENASPTHEYVAPGRYTAIVEVWEGSASSLGGPVTIMVGHAPIVLSVSATPTSGYAPLTVVYNVSASGGTGTYTYFEWHFGDGGTGSGAVVAHEYTSPGDYHATVTVEDSSGTQATAEMNVSVDSLQVGASSNPASPWVWAAAGFTGGFLVALGALFLLRRRGSDPPERSQPALLAPEAPHSEEAESGKVPSVGNGPTPPDPTETATDASPPAVPAVTLSHRVVVHLSQQGFVNPSELTPPEITQGGIARALGVKQNVLTNVLRRLEENGIVLSSVSHVRGELRRLKSYRLTAQGDALARELRGRKP